MKNLDLLKDKKIQNSTQVIGGIGMWDVFIYVTEKAVDVWFEHPEYGGGLNKNMKLGHVGGGRP